MCVCVCVCVCWDDPTDIGSSDSSDAGGMDHWRAALQWDKLDNEEAEVADKLALSGAQVGAVKGMQGMMLRAGGLVFGLGLVCPPIMLL